MKNIIKNMLVPACLLAVLPFMASCETDTDDNPTLRQPQAGETFALTAPADASTTTYDLINTDTIKVSSGAPDYGYKAVLTYRVQACLDNAFAEGSYTTLNSSQSYSSTVANPAINIVGSDLNTAVIDMYKAANNDAVPEAAMPVYLRVQANVDGTTAYSYSDVIELPSVLATYVNEIPVAYYLVGDFGCPNAWSNTDKSSIFYPETVTVQSYTTQWINGGNFKFWTVVGDWGTAYGAEAEDGSETGKILGNGDGAQNVKVPTVGEYYTVTIDMENMTYTWTRLGDQNPKAYTTIGLIGDFNGWGGDVAMTEIAPHNWYAEAVTFTAGGVKFRAEASWDVMDWGAGVDISIVNYGTGVKGGGNITVPAGTYDVYLNDITGQFVFVATE